jgi:hypothetical protein
VLFFLVCFGSEDNVRELLAAFVLDRRDLGLNQSLEVG